MSKEYNTIKGLFVHYFAWNKKCAGLYNLYSPFSQSKCQYYICAHLGWLVWKESCPLFSTICLWWGLKHVGKKEIRHKPWFIQLKLSLCGHKIFWPYVDDVDKTLDCFIVCGCVTYLALCWSCGLNIVRTTICLNILVAHIEHRWSLCVDLTCSCLMLTMSTMDIVGSMATRHWDYLCVGLWHVVARWCRFSFGQQTWRAQRQCHMGGPKAMSHGGWWGRESQFIHEVHTIH